MNCDIRQPHRQPVRQAGLATATLLGLAVVLAAGGAAVADHPPDPSTPHRGVPVIDAEQLIDLALADPTLRIVDSRLPSDRKLGFIEGSVNLPDTATSCSSLAELLPDMETPVVFYCNGPKCERSGRAGAIAHDCGYHSSYWFRGGFEEWVGKRYPTVLD